MPRTQVKVERLSKLIAEKGWSEKQISERAGLGHGYVSSGLQKSVWSPHPEKLQALARALDCDVEYLLGDTNIRRTPGRLVPGAAWETASTPPEAATFLTSIEDQVEASNGDLFLQYLPAGCSAFGVQPGSTLVVRKGGVFESGDLVLVADQIEGLGVRFLAEPWLISMNGEGRINHAIRNPGLEILGKILLAVVVPEGQSA